MLKCSNCNKIFSSRIAVGTGSYATIIGVKSQCPSCGSMENIPDGTFRATVEGFIEVLKTSPNPLEEAKELLGVLENTTSRDSLEKIKQNPRFVKFSKWIPNTPEKIATYIAIIYTTISLLTRDPSPNIEYATFVNQYNAETINITINPDQNNR